jgi:hypothetical protein
VDHELSSKINFMNLPLACVEERPSNVRRQKKSATRWGRSRGAGRTNGGGVQHMMVVEALLPLATYPAYPSASYLARLGSEEMIPPLRGLSSFVFLAGDTSMTDVDSILGKRGAGHQEGESVDRSLVSVLGAMIRLMGSRRGEGGPRSRWEEGWNLYFGGNQPWGRW